MSAASKGARASAAPKRASAPAAPELEPVPAPPILERQIAKPTLHDNAFAIERAFPSKSPAQVVGTFRQGLRREVTETQGQAARDADQAPTLVNSDAAHPAAEPQPMDKAVASESVQSPDLAHCADEPQVMDKAVAPERVEYPVVALSAIEPQPMDEAVESERAMTAIASRRARRLAYLTLLIAATAAWGYSYYDRSAQQLEHGQSAAPRMAGHGPTSLGATTAATQDNATSALRDTMSQPSTGAEKVQKAPSPAAPVVAKTRADPEPVRATRPLDDPASVNRPPAVPQAAGAPLSVRRSSGIDAGVSSRKDPPTFKECTEAVAALGLCIPSK